MTAKPRLGVSGLVRPNSGIGVVQRQAYPYLAERFDLVESPSRDHDGSFVGALRGLVAGLLPPRGPVTAFVNVVSPLPAAVRAPVTTVVHDLRWQRTRGGLARTYRAWDLRRAVRRSARLVCISQRTYDDLVEFAPGAAAKAVVCWEGPGLLPEGAFSPVTDGTVLLVGGAPHKRNELAATALVSARPDWLRRVVGVGVSDEVRRTFDEALGTEACTWHGRLSDEDMASAYIGAQTYVHLGVEEGFGLPYVEALAAGCDVVVVDQPLTRELLGDAGCYIEDGSAAELAVQIAAVVSVPEDVRRSRAALFSWRKFAEALA